MAERKHTSVQFDLDLIQRIKVVAVLNDETYSETLNRMCREGIMQEELQAECNRKLQNLVRKPTISELDAILTGEGSLDKSG